MNLQRTAMKIAAAATPFLFALGTAAATPANASESTTWDVELRQIGDMDQAAYCLENDANGDGLWDERYCLLAGNMDAEDFMDNPEVAFFNIENGSDYAKASQTYTQDGSTYKITEAVVTGPQEERVYQARMTEKLTTSNPTFTGTWN